VTSTPMHIFSPLLIPPEVSGLVDRVDYNGTVQAVAGCVRREND
jgi:hypothetical protein